MSENGAAIVRWVLTDCAHKKALESKPLGCRIVQSRPDSRTASSNAAAWR
jgi:hypothetical protein